MAGDMAAPSNASACWQTLANSLADKFASSRGQLSATSSCAALLCGAQYIRSAPSGSIVLLVKVMFHAVVVPTLSVSEQVHFCHC